MTAWRPWVLLPGVSRVITFPRRHLFRDQAGRNFLRELRSEKYDVAIDFRCAAQRIDDDC